MVTRRPAGSGPQTSLADGGPATEERHRALLEVLADVDEESLGVDDVAAAVAGHLAPPAGSARRGEHRQLRIALHHIHLPKLGALAGCEYDPQSSRLVAAEDSIGGAIPAVFQPAQGED